MKSFLALPNSERNIVFYAEDAHSMMHFEALIECLTKRHNELICYLTSEKNDPILESSNDKIKAFYIGEGSVRTSLFMGMRANILVMTMPDLEKYHIKRSRADKVHYLYLFHAMVSTHSNYRQGAFDHFDTIFCTSPFQIEEIRKTEQVYQLPEKHLYADGYRRLEALIDEVKVYRKEHGNPSDSGTKTIIVAPTWGENSLIEICGHDLVKVLLDHQYRVIVRPHPMTVKHNSVLLEQLQRTFGGNPRFELQTDIREKCDLYQSHVMISDWSGVGMEYAFSCERPVIYIDVPKKCHNPEADKLQLTPVEVTIRGQIGRIVDPQDLIQVPKEIEAIYRDASQFIEEIRRVRDESVFNLHNSVEPAVIELLRIARQHGKEKDL
ncbi:CDP-glycerol glycerophosphotransferase family protein [Pseudomaricurvus alkylphenolicus]|uniref:CDP-glycerol glycerophosphotransferase family protein n=1 Tax=Pseudomaricurvus alkylphenolicus TaxID=1306991 RepID=UPI00141E3B83|nr:CDP-glycerol glycerophosphotransferase family protein [Pseudomaricurvus alkylphenolicus]